MKLYKYTFGDLELYGPANDDEDAYERRIGIDPQFHYVPVVIEEVILEGYEITVTASKPTRDSVVPIELMHRDHLKQWLTSRNIPFTPQWGEDKLRELALQHI